MGLFTKKERPPCAICGGKVTGLFPWEIEGQKVCDTCYGVVDLPKGFMDHMTIEEFKKYMVFREENNQLRQRFQITQQIDFGWFDDKFVFDTENRLLCMDKNLRKTIYEGSQITSFEICEDRSPLFSGSAEGLVCYTSMVPQRVKAMEPQIMQLRLQAEMRREMEIMIENSRKDDDSGPKYHSSSIVDIPEPFKKFEIEIHFDHPYQPPVYSADKKGPEFSYSDPDVNDYLLQYENDVRLMEEMARALMEVAFPGALERRVVPDGAASAGSGNVSAPGVPVDTVEELKRFKELLDKGILTEEEFMAKKRQLLGI